LIEPQPFARVKLPIAIAVLLLPLPAMAVLRKPLAIAVELVASFAE
jgi:hypothetical protein